MADDNEPLDQWAARRDARRPEQGERRAASLGNEPTGAHVHSDAPRGVEEWDGQDWVPTGVSEDHSTAAAEAGMDADSRAQRVPLPDYGRLPQMPEPYRPTIPFYRP
ncbi:DUF6087 family protein [Streptomyces sp. NPDC004549]|uniref:DUF6087 family protein n=1 Tax=Streptomyces sp. NPDC004549 TaxID=3154283 RepID=UPI0033A313E7